MPFVFALSAWWNRGCRPQRRLSVVGVRGAVVAKSFGGICLAVLLGCSVLPAIELRRQRQYLAKWLHQRRLQNLMVILHLAV